MGESLRWFGAWGKTGWEVGYKARREAYAYGRGGRYQIERTHGHFVVRYQRPYVATSSTTSERPQLRKRRSRWRRPTTTEPRTMRCAARGRRRDER